MNDTVITAAFKRRELKIWAVCFVAAILVNAGAILWFETHWVELFTQIGYVVVLAVLLYVVVAGVRLVVWGVKRLACRKCRSAKMTGSHTR